MEKFLSQQNIEKRIDLCLKLLYLNDIALISQKGLELSINSKLACYLQQYFVDWNVDVEYGKEGNNCKKNLKNSWVIPDIIIHKRGIDGPNLCAIEAKGYWNLEDRKDDELKLRGYKESQDYQFTCQVEYLDDSFKFELI